MKDEKIAKVVKRGELNGSKASKTMDAEGGYVMVSFSGSVSNLNFDFSSLEGSTATFTCKSRPYLVKDHPQTTSNLVRKYILVHSYNQSTDVCRK